MALAWNSAGLEAARGAKPQAEVLPVFKVVSDWFTIDYRWTIDSRVLDATVSVVNPESPAAKGDLQPGDHLLAIDHVSVVGIDRGKFDELAGRPISPGHPKVYTFQRDRGLFGSHHKILDLIVAMRPPAAEQTPPAP